MTNAEEVGIASQQNDVEPKAADADGYEKAKDLFDDENSIKSPTCERFSIRGYVATIRTLDRNTCWPFPRLEEAGNLALPPLEIPGYRWWNCETCLRDITTSAESPIEKEYMTDTHASIQAYDGNFDRGCPMFLPSPNVDIREKRKENMLDCTEILEISAVDLKSGDAVGLSEYGTDKEKKDEVVTNSIREHGGTENIVPMVLENDKSEIADLEEKKSEIPHCLSNFQNSEEIINIIDGDEKVESAEMMQTVVETMAQILVTKTKDELGLKKDKSEERQIPCQDPNSWEYFSRNNNAFKQIREKMKGKEVAQANSLILGSENSIDANKITNSSNVPVHITCAENVQPGQQVVVDGKDEKIISGVESLTVRTMDHSIQNEDVSHRSSQPRHDLPCLNGNGSSCSEHMNINKTAELKESTELFASKVSLEKENVVLSEQTGKVNEPRSKRKPQKKRLISDIIASEPSQRESWNKETEESKSANEMEEIMCITKNNEQSPCPKEDHVKVTIDAVKMSSKPTIDTSCGISKVNIDTEKNNVMIMKQRPEKLKVMKKQRGGIESSDAFSTFASKNSSTSSLSGAVTNALQMPQGTSLSVPASRDKSPQYNFLNREYGQIGQKLSEMEDEIPVDIVELMAKNQHGRGLSHLKHFHESHKLHKDRSRLKMKETDLSQINKHVEGGTSLKQNTATPKSKARPNQTGKEKLQASLKNHCQSDLQVNDGQIYVSRRVKGNSFVSDKEGTTSGSCQGDLAMLQSTRCSNPWGKHSPDSVSPVLDETISGCNLPFPIDDTKSHGSVTHCDNYGTFSKNGMVADSMQLQGVSTYFGGMKMQNMCRKDTPAISEFRGSELPIFQKNTNSSINCNGYSLQNLTSTDSPQNMTRQSSDLGNSGKTFDILSESTKGNGIPNSSVREDGGSGPLYFNGQSNSTFLHKFKAQARQPSRKKHGFPSTPVLRLMGQSVAVPAKCGNKESTPTENGDNRNFSNLPQDSSQNHVNCFHSSGVMESQRETFSGTERVFTGSEASQDCMCVNEPIMNSIKVIPPVPKFRPSGHYAPNGYSRIFTPSSAVPGDADVPLESSNLWAKSLKLWAKSALRGTLFSGEKLNNGLQCTNGSNDNLKKFSTEPNACQSTKIVKGSSSTKGLRSYRPSPMAMHLNRNHRSAPDISLENRQHCFKPPMVLGSNPQQKLTKRAEKRKSLKLSKENEDSAFRGKNACNVEICTLNRNPAEINIEVEEDAYSFGYDHFPLSLRDLAHGGRKKDMTIPQGQKRLRTSKKNHMQEFRSQKYGYVGDTAKTNVGNLDFGGRK